MKSSQMKFGAILVVVLLLLILWWRSHHDEQVNTPAKLDETLKASPLKPDSSETKPHSPKPRASGPAEILGLGAARRARIDQTIAIKNVTVNFWGRVIDQDNKPISSATVSINVRKWFSTPPAGWNAKEVQYRIQTDDVGNFSVEGATGDSLSVESIVKNGYELSTKARLGFSFGGADSFRSDPAKPVLFRMWKRGEPQSLTRHRLSRVGIPCDGQPVRFDLLNGSKVSKDGHLIVRFRRDPLLLPNGNIHYDWTAEFEVVDGGLLPSDDEFMYEAPLNGYERVWRIEMQKTATNWVSTVGKSFYVKLNGGQQFARLNVRLSTNYNPPPTGLTLDIAINPSGSRNLE